MKLQGGYLPKIPGRPSAAIQDSAVPDRLVFPLSQGGLVYTSAVADGEKVEFGAPLAWAETGGGRLALPAPVAGVVSLLAGRAKSVSRILLKVGDAAVKATCKRYKPAKINAATIRQELAAAGVWPLIRSAKTGKMPALDGSEVPARLIVNFVSTEPYRTDGKCLLSSDPDRILTGLQFLPSLLSAPNGRIHVVVENAADPVISPLVSAIQGDTRFQLDTLPARYPAEHPRVLARALRRQDRTLTPSDAIWTLDAQAVLAIGACLADGIPLHERVVAIGGPGVANPCHRRVRIGTTLGSLLPPVVFADSTLLLRGGLFTGIPAASDGAVEAQDDGFFALPKSREREFLGFVVPGFDRVSALPCFGSALTGEADRHLTATLRGERRPCVACGLCEKVCPVGLLPQILHRYLYRDAIDQAQAAGVDLCIGCGLCSYVCPSKIELRQQFAEAGERLREEREHTEAARRDHEAQQARNNRETGKASQ